MAHKPLTRASENSPEVATAETAQWIPDWFTESSPAGAPFYAVVVHDDEVHTCRDYTETLQEVFGYSQSLAYQLTQELAHLGRVVAWKGPREEAERKAQQARDYHPRWRRGESVTAPRWVAESVPPLTITVVLAKPTTEANAAPETQSPAGSETVPKSLK